MTEAGNARIFHNVPFCEPCGALMSASCRELAELRCANCALRCWRARRLRPTCATSTVSGRWTGQRRRIRCAAPAAFLYVCGVKKHTQLVTQRADGPLPVSLNLSSSYISSARAAFGGKPETELFRF
jgi:hypothetical protein